MKLPKKNILLSIGDLKEKIDFFPCVKILQSLGYSLFATHGTHEFLRARWVDSVKLYKHESVGHEYVISKLQNWGIDFVVNAQSEDGKWEDTFGYLLRRTAVDLSIPLFTNIKLAKLFIESLEKVGGLEGVEVKSYEMF